ncbi:MAG: hypothetical protein ACRD2W_10005 [Acidimicrobiales bacterium]
MADEDRTSLFAPILGDGRPLLLALAGSLIFSGGFALFLAASGEFLPHDIDHLGMSADDLCRIASCRVVDFMVHDRAAFGGTLAGLGVLYVWLTVFPLARGERWAWWVWLVSASAGFASFLAYLGYGYLDSWHGAGTLLLLPVFVLGMVRARRLLSRPVVLWPPAGWEGGRSPATVGRAILRAGAGATAAGGLIILWVGVSDTFVPEDLEFMRVSAQQLRDVNPRLVPLMAHDRAGFGGAVFTMGLTTFLSLWFAPPARHLHEAVATAGAISLVAAIGIHGFVGYTDFMHLLPALGAATLLVFGLALAVQADSDLQSV